MTYVVRRRRCKECQELYVPQEPAFERGVCTDCEPLCAEEWERMKTVGQRQAFLDRQYHGERE